VLLHLGNQHLPSIDGMTLFAVRSKLALVDVRMAIRALNSHIGKNRLRMALRARHALVHTTQRKLCEIVIELWQAANWFPSERGVTVLAGDIQISVRTPSCGIRLRLTRRLDRGGQKHP